MEGPSNYFKIDNSYNLMEVPFKMLMPLCCKFKKKKKNNPASLRKTFFTCRLVFIPSSHTGEHLTDQSSAAAVSVPSHVLQPGMPFFLLQPLHANEKEHEELNKGNSCIA